MKNIKIFIKFPNLHFSEFHVWIFVILLSVVAYFISYRNDFVLAYSDARAHLNIARTVFDNLKPGLAQLGAVWLPLPHVLMLPLIGNNWMWHSGFAGSVFSMVFFVLSSIYFFRLGNIIFKNKYFALLAVVVFATNLNILYMQTTPMTEIPLMFFFIASSYYLAKWNESNNLSDLLFTSLFVFLSVLTRYDGWFHLVFMSFALVLIELVRIKESEKTFEFSKIVYLFKKRILGIVILFLSFASLGAFLWIIWNKLIFKDSLYFLLGPYSAHAQQKVIESASGLISKYNLYYTFLIYLMAVADNVGIMFLIMSIIGLYYLIKRGDKRKILLVSTLFSPLLFHSLSLFLGNSIIMAPEIVTDVIEGTSGSLFNIRYGMMMVPAVALLTAYLSKKSEFVKWIVLILIVLQPLLFLKKDYIITLKDGLVGSSASNAKIVADWMHENITDDGELILLSMVNSSLAFDSGFPMKRFIHEGTGIYWQTSIVEPAIYSSWIILPKGNIYNPLYVKLVKEGGSKFLKEFEAVKEFDDMIIYRRKAIKKDVVYIKNNSFTVNEIIYPFVGVNSYDLIFRTPNEISTTLSSAKENGFNVVRFWVFGEGSDHLIQPKPGVYNEILLNNLDYILATAQKLDMKVILTLSNYWEAYGGIRQYLDWVNLPNANPADLDRFFTDDRTKLLYRNYVKNVILRKNSITETQYKDDPTIFSWELMNEPRSSSEATSNVVIEWITEMTDYVKSLDKYHLVTTGHEGFIDSEKINPNRSSPTINEINNIFDLDIMTGHFYVDSHGSEKPITEFEILEMWSDYAKTTDNAFFIEEVGFSKKAADNGGVARYELYKNLLNTAKKNNIQGIILWNWALKIDDSFGISPMDPRDGELIKLFKDYSESLKVSGN